MLENFKKLKNMIYSGNYVIYYDLKVASEIPWLPRALQGDANLLS